MGDTPPAAVLVPVKAFGHAKARLSPALDEAARSEIARSMARRVLAAASPLPVFVACNDRDVGRWAESLGAGVIWTPDTGLNDAVQRGFAVLRHAGHPEIVIAHADLPNAESLDRATGFDGITLVPDRFDDGTNVLTVPAGAVDFTFAYGAASFTRHLVEAARVGCATRVLRLPDLQWDVDTPDDLPCPSPITI